MCVIKNWRLDCETEKLLKGYVDLFGELNKGKNSMQINHSISTHLEHHQTLICPNHGYTNS